MQMRVRSLALLSGLKVQHCLELWYRSQTQLGSGMALAVAVARSYSSNSTPDLGATICLKCSLKKTK